jgi:hypothetical protein
MVTACLNYFIIVCSIVITCRAPLYYIGSVRYATFESKTGEMALVTTRPWLMLAWQAADFVGPV